MSVIIALDLGTTGNRAIAFNADGHSIATAYEEFAIRTPHSGWVEQDPIVLIETAIRVLKNVLDQIKEPVAGLGITNQRETTIVWDKKTGQPVYPAIVWQDRRTAEFCQTHAKNASWIKQKTGLFLDPYFSATKLQWILSQSPDYRTKAEHGELLFGTVDSWVIWHLTQGQTHATDVSNASRTLLMNLNTLQYDPDLLSFFNIPKACLPEIRESMAVFGHTHPHILGQAIPILSVLGDQQAALFAQCGNKIGDIKNTYGTGLFIMANAGQVQVQSPTLVTTVGWSIKGNVSYALEGSVFVGGSAIQWLRDGLGIIHAAQESEALATSVPNSDGVLFVPALTGLGAPYWQPHTKGMLLGLTRGTTKAHIARATLESLAFQTKDVVTEMDAVLSEKSKALKVDGGATHNTFLMQCQADLLQKSIFRATVSESTALGTGLLAGHHASIWDESVLRKKITLYTEILPQKQSSHLLKQYQEWKRAINTCIEFYAID